MKIRAFIVAIEDYPVSTSTSAKLPGTIASAEKFANWLQDVLNVDQDNIFFCSSMKGFLTTHGTKSPEIKQAIVDLINCGHNETDLLFVYLSGHGVMIPGREYDLDILLSSDFVNPQISGSACIEVNELTELLEQSLGIGTHLYFIDACRTQTQKLDATRLGITAFDATSGRADWFQLSSGKPFEAVPSDSLFIESLLNGLGGKCNLVKDDSGTGLAWITFQNVAEAVAESFRERGREIFVRSKGKTDYRITRTPEAGAVSTIVTTHYTRFPPVELLTEFDEIIFLGETNGQLPWFIKDAHENRMEQGKGLWKKIDVLFIKDLSRAFRTDKPLNELELERDECDAFFRREGKQMVEALALYRYNYAGTYGSFWKNNSGKRRAHVSAGLLGEDIRVSPASDYVDFPGSRHPKVESYFELARRVIESDDCERIFSSSDAQCEGRPAKRTCSTSFDKGGVNE